MAKPKKDEIPTKKVIERVQAYAAGKPTAPGAERRGPSARRVVSSCQRMDDFGKDVFYYRPGFEAVLKDTTISDEAKADKLCALIIPVVDLIGGLSVQSGANNAAAMASAKNGDAEAKNEIKVEAPVSIKLELDARSKPLDTSGDRAAPPRGGPPRETRFPRLARYPNPRPPDTRTNGARVRRAKAAAVPMLPAAAPCRRQEQPINNHSPRRLRSPSDSERLRRSSSGDSIWRPALTRVS